MKSLIIALSLLTASMASASSLVALRFDGKTQAGEACTLFVDHWYYDSDTVQNITTLRAVVRTPWQQEGHPALTVKASFTPYSLYVRDAETKDQIAVNLPYGANTPEKVDSFSFQGWDETRGLFQAYCRISK